MDDPSGRRPLRPGDGLTLSPFPQGIDPLHFEILGTISMGRSAFCYQALLGHQLGQLKEFYPADTAGCYLALQRDAGNQLTAPGLAMAARFHTMCRCYAAGYEALDQASSALAGHQLCRGGSVYVWTPELHQGESLGTLLDRLHQTPGGWTLDQFRQVLQILRDVTAALRELHAAGLVHLDISASNVYLTPEGVRLWDHDGIHSLDDPFGISKDNRQDIYAVGLLLFEVIMPHWTYTTEDYDAISACVTFSPVVRPLRPRSHAFLRCMLEQMLRRCLAPRPSRRYRCCEELLADLDQTIQGCIP